MKASHFRRPRKDQLDVDFSHGNQAIFDHRPKNHVNFDAHPKPKLLSCAQIPRPFEHPQESKVHYPYTKNESFMARTKPSHPRAKSKSILIHTPKKKSFSGRTQEQSQLRPVAHRPRQFLPPHKNQVKFGPKSKMKSVSISRHRQEVKFDHAH